MIMNHDYAALLADWDALDTDGAFTELTVRIIFVLSTLDSGSLQLYHMRTYICGAAHGTL